MYYEYIFGGLAVTILTILFGVMSLAPLLMRAEDEPVAARLLEFPEECCVHAARPKRVAVTLRARRRFSRAKRV